MSPNFSESSHLAGVVVCITGDPTWDKDKNTHIREQCTDENVNRWLKYRGGRLDEEVTNATTHLICSRDAYKARLNNDKIKTARELGCHLVTYEWLTDTLQLWDYHKRRAPPELYHPGRFRDGEAISHLFRTSEKKPRSVKKVALPAADSTAVSGGNDANAAEEAAETGSEQMATPEEKSPQKSSEEQCSPKLSESRQGRGTKVVDGIKRLDNSANDESHKPVGKPEYRAKVKNQVPTVDLSHFTIYKDESGLHQVEVGEHGRRLVLELYESKSVPKTYLFGMRVYQKPGSSKCTRHFPSKAPRDKNHELQRFKSRYWRCTGRRWRQQASNPSNGSFPDRQPRAVPKKSTGSVTNKNNLDKPGKVQKESPTKSLAFPHRHRQVDLKAAFKRKSSSSEKQPAKELKVTKHSVAGGSGKVNNGGPKTSWLT